MKKAKNTKKKIGGSPFGTCTMPDGSKGSSTIFTYPNGQMVGGCVSDDGKTVAPVNTEKPKKPKK